jgi:hypothetical protein
LKVSTWLAGLHNVQRGIAMVTAPVVLMQAVEAGHDVERIGVLEATRRGVPSVPVALPLGPAFELAERFGPSPLAAALLAVGWQLGWVAVQSTRGVLIPALHTVYLDLCVSGAAQN